MFFFFPGPVLREGLRELMRLFKGLERLKKILYKV